MSAALARVTFLIVRLRQAVVSGALYVKSRIQAIFEWILDRLVIWLCRHYQPNYQSGFEF